MESQIYRIVFQDADLLVIEKQSPFLSQRADSGDGESLSEFIARTLDLDVLPVHRLDREVLGLMIFALNQGAADELSRQFREREVKKIYWAKVRGRVRSDLEHLVHFLKKNPKNNRTTVFPRETPGAKRAELDYEVLERTDSATELLVSLKTGRSHQIRAQLAKIGHSIVGDERYGTKFEVGEHRTSIQLKSIFLSVKHPRSREVLSWSLMSEISSCKLLKDLGV